MRCWGTLCCPSRKQCLCMILAQRLCTLPVLADSQVVFPDGALQAAEAWAVIKARTRRHDVTTLREHEISSSFE